MKAIVHDRFGAPEVLRMVDLPTPAPRRREFLIKIHATTVTSGDCRVRSLNMPLGFGMIGRAVFGFKRPRRRVLGVELAGEVVAVGEHAARYKIGDQVFGICGMQMGCYAQYKRVVETAALAIKPSNLTYEEAAALSFGGTTALSFLRRAGLRRGERVLVNGASGSVGTAAVQLARHFGAEVTGVCSTANVELVRSLGANHVIDYARDDFAQRGVTYDVIVDAVGTAPFSRCKAVLNDQGRLLLILATLPQMLQVPWVTLGSGKRIIAGPMAERADDVAFLADLVRAGALSPVIDRRYPLEQIVEAHRYVDTGRKRGNVVITVPHAD